MIIILSLNLNTIVCVVYEMYFITIYKTNNKMIGLKKKKFNQVGTYNSCHCNRCVYYKYLQHT